MGKWLLVGHRLLRFDDRLRDAEGVAVADQLRFRRQRRPILGARIAGAVVHAHWLTVVLQQLDGRIVERRGGHVGDRVDQLLPACSATSPSSSTTCLTVPSGAVDVDHRVPERDSDIVVAVVMHQGGLLRRDRNVVSAKVFVLDLQLVSGVRGDLDRGAELALAWLASRPEPGKAGAQAEASTSRHESSCRTE